MSLGFRVLKNKQPTLNHACLWDDWNDTKFHGKRKITYFWYYIAKHLIVINWDFWTLQDTVTLCLFHLHPGTMKHLKPSERTFSGPRKIGALLLSAECWTVCESVCWGLQNFIEIFIWYGHYKLSRNLEKRIKIEKIRRSLIVIENTVLFDYSFVYFS